MARIRALASVNPPLRPPVDLALRVLPSRAPLPELLRELIPHRIGPEGRKLAFSSSFLPLYRLLFSSPYFSLSLFLSLSLSLSLTPTRTLPTLLSFYRRLVTTLGSFACISLYRKGTGCIPELSALTGLERRRSRYREGYTRIIAGIRLIRQKQ